MIPSDMMSVSDLENEEFIDSRDLKDLRVDLLARDAKDEDDEALLCALDSIETETRGFDAILINEDHFQDFIQQEMEDCGLIQADCILTMFVKWDEVAAQAKTYYNSCQIGSTNFLFRL